MGPARAVGGVALLLALGLGTRAEPELKKAVVAKPAEVRGGPSDKYYATSKLNPGEEVYLADETHVPWLAGKPAPAGWVAILPPRNSFSWVNKRFLTFTNATSAIVQGDAPVPVRVGSSLYDGPPNVEQARLKRGEIVTMIGPEKTDAEGIWVPINSPPQEVRYIPADALQVAASAQSAATPPPPAPAPTPPPAVPAAGTTASTVAPPATPDDPLWVQAEQAQREGKREEAMRLYLQLANGTRDHDLCIRCWNRIEFLRGNTAPAPQATTPAASYYPKAAGDSRIMPIPGYPSGQPAATTPAIRPTSQYTYTPEIAVPAAGQRPQANYTPPPAAGQAAAQTRGPGILRKSAWLFQGQEAYALDMGTNQPLLYVTAQPGVSLEAYKDKTVILSGPVSYHSGWRKEHMTAVQVTPAQ